MGGRKTRVLKITRGLGGGRKEGALIQDGVHPTTATHPSRRPPLSFVSRLPGLAARGQSPGLVVVGRLLVAPGHSGLDAMNVGDAQLVQLGDQVQVQLHAVVVDGAQQEGAKWGQADAHAVAADNAHHGLHHFQGEAAPVLDRAAIAVGARIDTLLQELTGEGFVADRRWASRPTLAHTSPTPRPDTLSHPSPTPLGHPCLVDQVAVGAMDLDAVESGIQRALGRPSIVGHDTLDLVYAQGTRCGVCQGLESVGAERELGHAIKWCGRRRHGGGSAGLVLVV